MTPRRAGRVLPVILIIVFLVWALDNLAAEAVREVSYPWDSDAIAFFTGARLLATDPSCLYCPDVQKAFEATTIGISPSVGFLNPFTNIAAGALLLEPLSRLDIHTATAIAVGVSVLLLAVAVGLALMLTRDVKPGSLRLLVVVTAVLVVPELHAPFQWDALLAVALLGAAILIERDRPVAAGLLLATLVLKPQVLWLAIPLLALAGAWRVVAGIVAGGAVWLGVSVALTGVSGLEQLVRLIGSVHVAETGRTLGVPGLVSAVTHNDAAAFGVGLVGAALLVLLVWRLQLVRDRPVEALAGGVALSMLCAPHVYGQDLILLSLGLLLIARRSPAPAIGIGFLLSVLWLIPAWLDRPDHLELVVLALVLMGLVRISASARQGGSDRTSVAVARKARTGT